MEIIPQRMPCMGSVKSPIVVICDAPNKKLWDSCAPVGGEQFTLFKKYAQKYGFSSDDFAFISPCAPMPDTAEGSDKRQKAHLQQYREAFATTLKSFAPRFIVFMGKHAGFALLGKPIKIMQMRGVLREETGFNCPILPIFSPGHMLQRPELLDMFDADFNTMRLIVDGGYRINAATNAAKEGCIYTWCNDLSELIAKPPVCMGVDTETWSTDPTVPAVRWYRPETRVLTVQLSWEDGQAIAIPTEFSYAKKVFGSDYGPRAFKRVLVQLKQILENCSIRKTGFNFKFDYHMLRKLDITVQGWVHDAQLLAFFADENMPEKSQDECVRRWVPSMSGYADRFNRETDKGHMELVTPDKLLQYAAGDADAVFRLTRTLVALVKRDRRQYNCYERIHFPALKAFAEVVEPRGIRVDIEALAAFHQTLIEEQGNQYAALLKLVPPVVRRRHIEKGQSFTRADFLKDILFSKDGFNLTPLVWTDSTKKLPLDQRVPSVSTKTHLPYFKDTNRFVELLIPYMQICKLDSTYVGQNAAEDRDASGFWQYIYNDHIHPSFFLHATVTGRVNSRDPNGQNLPKRGPLASAYRKIFIPSPGYSYLEVDLSQAELRLVAWMSGDRTMLKAFKDGIDIHAMTASLVMGIAITEFMALDEKTRKSKRQQAKAVNFGLVYGMMWRKFQRYAKTEYNVDLTETEAQDLVKKYFQSYRGIDPWHKTMRDFVARHSYVRSLHGAIRHLPNIRSSSEGIRMECERQAINCLSDDTEMLTEVGWKTVDELRVGELVFSVNKDTGEQELHPLEGINSGYVDQSMLHYAGSIDAVATPEHNWLVDRYTHHLGKTSGIISEFKKSSELSDFGDHRIWLTGKGTQVQKGKSWTNDAVQLLGWVLTDGYYKRQYCPKTGKEWGPYRVGVTQSKGNYLKEIDELFIRLGEYSHQVRCTGQHIWDITNRASTRIRKELPDKTLTSEVLLSLTHKQRVLLYETMLKGDGCWDTHAGRFRKFVAGSEDRANAFLMLCALIGQPASAQARDYSGFKKKLYDSMDNIPNSGVCWLVELKQRDRAQSGYRKSWKQWAGRVWCPTVKNGAWIAKRNGKVFVTGNSPIQRMGSDIGLIALQRLCRDAPLDKICPIAFIHDALVFEVRNDFVQRAARWVTFYFQSTPFDKWFSIQPPIPITADASIGEKNLGEMVERHDLKAEAPPWYDWAADGYESLEEALSYAS